MPRLSVPFFGGAEVEIDDVPPGGPDRAELDLFLALGPDDRARAARHVHAYCLDAARRRGLPPSMSAVPEAGAIWDHVEPVALGVDWPAGADARCSVILEASCDWDEEHGLGMVWEGGALVCVGPFGDVHDGGPDADGRRVVYDAVDPSLRTHRDADG